MKNKADIGMIGLAVMGENLALNIESKGYTVAVYNRTVPGIEEGIVARFISGRGRGKNFMGSDKIEDFVKSLERPRKIMMMVKAGKPVDDVIEQLLPLLDRGDILIDGGNSHFPDTIRRTKYLESKELLFIGTGVSGGEEGALHGPSIMPGGSPAAWPHVKPILQAIAAKVADGTPCCDWVGSDGAGHFVKMVHNGIEYGQMQAISEGFDILHASEYELDLSAVATMWNHGSVIRSWLMELASDAFARGGNDLDDLKGWVNDSGEGRWTVLDAIDHDVPAPIITLSLMQRFRSRRWPDSYADRVLAALRNEFGGHAVVTADEALPTGSGR
jgi:6-phosphogluconate dehydrogenase